MKDRILVIIKSMIFLAVVTFLFVTARDFGDIKISRSDVNLIIYGDTISSEYNPFVEDGHIFLSLDTVSQFIDEELFYDEDTQKVIVTTEDALYKFTVGKNIATKNLREYDAKACCRMLMIVYI